MRVYITDVRDEPQHIVSPGVSSSPAFSGQNDNVPDVKTDNQSIPIGTDVANVPDSQTVADAMISDQNPPALCVWLRPDVIAALDLQANGEVFLYQPPLTTNIAVRVLQHPGFCYLSSHDAASVNIPNETIVELHARKSLTSYVQVHPSLENMHGSCLDFSLADALRIDAHDLAFMPMHAQLYWIAKVPVDDIQNKARAVVCLPQETLTQEGYNPQEPVSVFYEGKAHNATIKP